MRALRIVLFSGAVCLALLLGLFWLTIPSARPGQLLVRSKTPFTQGPYFVYSQPWGGDTLRIMRPWTPYADATLVDLKHFPRETTMAWRWPPITAGFGPGVWGYDQISYGDYDGGTPEKNFPPIRVIDLKTLHQDFSWSMKAPFGDGNVLTEFYLRSSTTDVESKMLEIGWFLHLPDSSRKFFESSSLVGTYRDEQGRRWTVRIAEKFCMFAPEALGDVPKARIDMLRALRWLQTKGLVNGKEWVWGVGMGVEPVIGFGRFTLHDWHVTRN